MEQYILIVGVDARIVYNILNEIKRIQPNETYRSMVVPLQYSYLEQHAKNELENATLLIIAVEFTDRTGIIFYEVLFNYISNLRKHVLLIVPNRPWPTPSDVYCDDDVESELNFFNREYGHMNLISFSYRLGLSPYQHEKIANILSKCYR